MSHHDGHPGAFTGQAAASDVRAALTDRGEGRLATSGTDTGAGKRPGLGGLWLLLVPPACCGGPLLIAALATTGDLDLATHGDFLMATDTQGTQGHDLHLGQRLRRSGPHRDH